MTVDKLSRLFSALGQPSQSYNSTTTTQEEVQTSTASSSEAVKVSKSFGTSASEVGGDDRRAKIEELKQAVADGSYNPNSRDVAASVARELFA